MKKIMWLIVRCNIHILGWSLPTSKFESLYSLFVFKGVSMYLMKIICHFSYPPFLESTK